MKRRQVHHTSTSNDFHAALCVDEYPRPSIDVCTIGNSPTLHTNLAQPPLSVQLWVSQLSKSCQHFLNFLVKEKQLWQVNVLSPRMPLYGTLSLFRTSFAGCYAFPCISLECDVSTCKPYVPCVTLCTLSLSCQTTLTKRQKKNRKKEKKIVRCECTTKLTQVSSFSESHTGHGRARHQIRDWPESGRSRELLTPGTMTHAGRAASSPEIFRPFLTVCLTVFPFEFRPRTYTIGFYGKKSFISELMILECSFPLSYAVCVWCNSLELAHTTACVNQFGKLTSLTHERKTFISHVFLRQCW